MPDYDGDVKLKVSLTPGDIKSTAKQLQNSLKEAFSSPAIEDMSKDVERVVNNMQKAGERTSTLVNKMEQLEHTQIPTEEYTAVQKQIEATEQKLAKLNERMERYRALGGKQNTRSFKAMKYDVEELQNTLAYAKGELQDLVDTGQAFTLGSDTAEYQNLATQLSATNNQVLQLINAFAGLTSAEEETEEESENVHRSFSEFVRDSVGGVGRLARSLLSTLLSTVKKVGSTVLSSLVGAFKKLGSSLKSTHSHSKGLSGSFKTLLRYGLGIRSVYALFNKLRNAVKEGFNNLKQYDSTLANNLTAVSNASTQLKNSVAAAISPLANSLLPILTAIINALSEAISKLGAFLAMLSGKSTFVKATKVQEGYADSLNGSAGAAKNLRKQLAGFDELNTLSGDNAGGGGGGGGGAGVGDMFTTEEIPLEVSNFVEKLKAAWESANFTDIGRTLGSKINEALETADQFITSEKVLDTARRIAMSISTLFNGLGDGIDWETVGKTFADGLNVVILTAYTFLASLNLGTWGTGIATALNTAIENADWSRAGRSVGEGLNDVLDLAYRFLTTFDFRKFGNKISFGINQAVATIRWSEIGGTITSAVVGVFNLLIGFIEGLDWYQLGQSVKEMLVNIDWGAIASALFEAIGAALGGLAAFLWGLIEEAWNSVKDWWHDKAYEDGEFTISGLLDGILEVLSNIGTWIKENIFQPFIDGFKKTFDINSPSKVMLDLGKEIIQGMLNGITEKFTTLLSTVKEKWENLKTQARQKWEEIKTAVVTKAETIKSNLSTKFESIKTTVGDKISTLKNTVTTHWETIKSNVTNTAETLKSSVTDKFSDIKSNLSTKMTEIKNSLSNHDWGSIGSNLVSGLKQGIVNNWDSLLTKAGNLANKLISKVKNTFGIASPSKVFRRQIGQMLPLGLSEGIEDTEDDALDTVSSMTNAITAAASDIKLPDIITGKVIPYSMTGTQAQHSVMQDLISTLKSGDIVDTLSAILSTASQEITELRTQNDLLTQLLKKQLVLQPSATLGRVVAQSTQQYNKVVGR